MKLIKARCFTNLDDYEKEKWPEYFPELPVIGDRILSKNGKCLRVVGREFLCTEQHTNDPHTSPDCCVRIELNKLTLNLNG